VRIREYHRFGRIITVLTRIILSERWGNPGKTPRVVDKPLSSQHSVTFLTFRPILTTFGRFPPNPGVSRPVSLLYSLIFTDIPVQNCLEPHVKQA